VESIGDQRKEMRGMRQGPLGAGRRTAGNEDGDRKPCINQETYPKCNISRRKYNDTKNRRTQAFITEFNDKLQMNGRIKRMEENFMKRCDLSNGKAESLNESSNCPFKERAAKCNVILNDEEK
jgi:hypothetical protein